MKDELEHIDELVESDGDLTTSDESDGDDSGANDVKVRSDGSTDAKNE